MLMLQMVRQMRQSISFDDEKEQGFGNETMTDTFDVEFSRYLAQNGGIGVGKMIEDTLLKQQAAASDAAKSGGGAEPAASSTGTIAFGCGGASRSGRPLRGGRRLFIDFEPDDAVGTGRRRPRVWLAELFVGGRAEVSCRGGFAGGVWDRGAGGGRGGHVCLVLGRVRGIPPWSFATGMDSICVRAFLPSMDVQTGDQVQAGQSVGRAVTR